MKFKVPEFKAPEVEAPVFKPPERKLKIHWDGDPSWNPVVIGIAVAIFFLAFSCGVAVGKQAAPEATPRVPLAKCIVCRLSATLDSEKVCARCRSKPPQELQKMLPPQLFASLFPNHKATGE